MAEFPALPLWTDAYLADTRHLSRDEHGAYLLLLMEAWRRPRATLPNDDALLARLTVSTPEEWKRLKPTIMAFFFLDASASEFRQKRLTREHDFSQKKRRQNKAAAASRWKTTEKPDANASSPHMRMQSEWNAPSPLSKKVSKKEAKWQNARAAYTDSEWAHLTLEFDKLDVDNRVRTLWEWCEKKGIANTDERKAVIWKKLAAEKGAGALVTNRTNPRSAKASDELAHSKLVRK